LRAGKGERVERNDKSREMQQKTRKADIDGWFENKIQEKKKDRGGRMTRLMMMDMYRRVCDYASRSSAKSGA